MAELWIVHRDRQVRAALARLLGGVEALVEAPGAARFESAPAPRAIVLGVAGDFEAELEFVHRVRALAASGRWLIVAEPSDWADAKRLLGAVGDVVLPWPGGAHELRERVRAALARREVPSLGERRLRDAVTSRFARWFHDLTLPEVLLALDPKLADVPVLIAGEPGTGRSVLARYLHHFGHPEGGVFVDVPCPGAPDADALRARLPRRGRGRWTVCLEEVDALPAALQRELRDWVELGPPAEPPAAAVRWIATCADSIATLPGRALDPELALALGGIAIRVPPLRERAGSIGAIAEETAAAWCRRRRERPRGFAPDAVEALRAHPWPGNLRELEAVVVRSLVAEAADPLRAEHLHFEAERTAAPRAGDLGAVERLPEAEDALAALGGAELEPAAPTEGRRGEAVGTDRELVVEAEPETAAPMAFSDPTLRRMARAVAHEVSNPLVAIRTLAELLPAHHEDPEFRERFASLVAADTGRIAGVVERLARFAEMPPPRPAQVDVAELLERLLEERRPRVEERRLLVLQELDRDEPFAWADPEQLAFAFGALLDRAVELVPERGDLYLASKHHATAEAGAPASVRVLLRFQRASGTPGAPLPPELDLEETVLELPVAEAVLRAQAGRVTVDTSRPDETLVLVDLPAPPAGR